MYMNRHTHTRTHTHVHTHTFTHANTHIHMQTCSHNTCMCADLYDGYSQYTRTTPTYLPTHFTLLIHATLQAHTYTHIRKYTRTHTHTYIQAHSTDTHTHAQTHLRSLALPPYTQTTHTYNHVYLIHTQHGTDEFLTCIPILI